MQEKGRRKKETDIQQKNRNEQAERLRDGDTKIERRTKSGKLTGQGK